MSWTVFYAWQSDSPSNANRSLIQKALEEAIGEVRSDRALEIDPRLDKDTQDVPGSPDIVATIFEKIASAAVFVADVTIVGGGGTERATPNPNVLIELGYALRVLGGKRIVLVMNTAFGGAEQLPFDIRQKRALTYELTADAGEKAPERRRLQRTLVEALRLGLKAAEEARPQPPPQPTVADALVSAIEQQLPSQRRAAQRYVTELVRDIDALRPADGRSDDALVAAIDASTKTVESFWRVAEAAASHRSLDVMEELLRGFEQVLRRYEIQQGASGNFYPTDFDFFKFLGHELFVVFIAALLRQEAWETLDEVLGTPLLRTGTIRPDGNVSFIELSEYTALLDDIRKEKLKQGNTTRFSIHADILKERYSVGPLSEQLGWDAFKGADFFLFVRSRTAANEAEYSAHWVPWSAVFLRDLPSFVTRSEQKSYASRVARGLGVSDVQNLGGYFKRSLNQLEKFYRSIFWHRPGRDYDFAKIASR